ncbi:MAG: hypothetical protein K2N56_05310 [Oscillospiraceae bacterium]|nr:hypothetical protein [Oscillospiraceae bacterium]
MYVYESVTGINHYVAEKTNKTSVNASLNAATAKKYLKGLPVGTYVRVLTAGGTKHSISILETTDDQITIYHANYGIALSDKCKISLETISWATFAARFTKLLHYVD